MNGELVGEWTTLRTGTPLFRYTTAWSQSPRARALSLSIPITADFEVRGTVVDNYFDNLLPDNPAIRRRIRERFAELLPQGSAHGPSARKSVCRFYASIKSKSPSRRRTSTETRLDSASR